MQTEFRVRPHGAANLNPVIEVWYDGSFVGTITGAIGEPGINFISRFHVKYELTRTALAALRVRLQNFIKPIAA